MPQITDSDVQRIKDLVKQRDIAGARRLLQSFQGERAAKMLAQLNEKYPSKTTSPQARNSQRFLVGGVVAAIVLASLALVGVLIGLKRQQDAYQPLTDLFNATPLPTWTPPYNSSVEALEWMCYELHDDRGIFELDKVCQQEAALFYQENTATVDACYASGAHQNDFLQCALDQEFFFDGRYIEASEGS